MKIESLLRATLKDNICVALFDGWITSPYPNTPNKLYKKDDNGNINKGISIDYLNYHSDWNLLMPVIRKAKASVSSYKWDSWPLLNTELLKCDDPKYLIPYLVKFIKWYNKNNKS